jgi:hypothetical protein
VSLRGAYQNGQYHGTFRAYDSQGQVLETYELVEGTGTFTIWYARSKPSFRRSYRAGQRHGPWIYWHRNGQKSQELTFVEGHQHGTTTSWAQDGAKSAQSEYVDGRPHGLQKRWQNGALKEEEEYVYGNRVRHTRHDTEDGTPHTQRWSLPTYEGEVATRTHSAIQRRWQACTANPQCEEQATNCCACEAEDYVAVHYRFEEEARAALGQDCEDTRCPQMDCQEVGARCDDGYCVSLTR